VDLRNGLLSARRDREPDQELHELQIDRTSCSDFWANQFRVLLTAAAYVLLQELRLRAAGTDCARAQVWTLRERLLKLGARVLVSVRRVRVHLPHPFRFFPPSGEWHWHSERRPGSTGLALPQNFPYALRNCCEEEPCPQTAAAPTSTHPPVSQHHRTTKNIPAPLCSANLVAPNHSQRLHE